MRILFTSFPGLGHLHPLVPLALAAGAAGHDVRLATGPDLVGWARRCGLDAHPVGLGSDVAHHVAERDFDGPERSGHMFTDVWVPGALADLQDLAAGWAPDLVVSEEQEYAGVLLAARRGIPCVTHSWAAPARPAAGRAFQTGRLVPLWERELPGAAPRRVGELYLDACPPPFQTPDVQDIGRQTQVVNVRPGLFDGPPEPIPEVLRGLPRPAAYVTLGTVTVFSTPGQLARIAAALAPHVASVVVTTGPNPVDSLSDLPRNVHSFAYLPQSSVLPAVDLLVSHGGAGGTIGALCAGLPHLVLPGHGASQISSAEAVQRLGIGLRLNEGDRDPALIATTARQLITDPRFAAAARELRAQVEVLPGPREVVTMLDARYA